MNENYVSVVGWLSLVYSHATARVSEGAFPWLGLRRAGATVDVRMRCERGMQEQPCEGAVQPRQPCASVPPFHFENFRQAWQKCVAKYGNARPRPKQDKYVVLRTRSTSIKKKGGVFLRGINRYKSSFHVSINAYFFLQSPKI